jgi:dCTP deaminase
MLAQLPSGILVDHQLNAVCAAGELITHNFDANNIRKACYELRASDIFCETYSSREDKRVSVDASGYILRPNSYVTAIVLETINLPDDVLARILAKGQL